MSGENWKVSVAIHAPYWHRKCIGLLERRMRFSTGSVKKKVSQHRSTPEKNDFPFSLVQLTGTYKHHKKKENCPRMQHRLSSFIPAVAIIVSCTATGCQQNTESSPAPPLPEVTIMEVTTQQILVEPEFIGQTESSRPVEIRSQVTGIIKEKFFVEGRTVKKGDRLYQIDPVPFQAAFRSARGRLAQAEAKLIQAKQNLARVKPLLAEQAVSQKDVGDAVAEEHSAKAALESAKGDLTKAKWDLDNTRILAPIDGMIERTRVYEGRLVSAQTDLLTSIYQIDPMYVTISAPESFLLKRRRDMMAKKIKQSDIVGLRGVITFEDGTRYSHEGVLDFTGVGLQTETGSRQARVTFPNPKGLLLPGQFVTVRLIGTVQTGAILIPQRAVQQSPKGPVVFIVGEGDKVEMREIKATRWQGNQWVVEEGLKIRERIVTEGLHRIKPGIQVRPILANRTSSTPSNPEPEPGSESSK